MEVALDLLEPLGGVARRTLQPKHLSAALVLVASEGRRHVGLGMQVLGESYGAFQRELGAGAHREMGSGGRVAE